MLTPNRELKRQALKSLEGNWGNSVLTIILFILISIVAAFVPLGSILIGWPLSIGIYYFFLKLVTDKDSSVGNVFKPFSFYGNSLLLKFLMVLITFIVLLPLIIAFVVVYIKIYLLSGDIVAFESSFVSLGLIAILDIALLYYVSLRLSLAAFILSDYPYLAADKAISLSWKLMRDKFWKLLGLYLSFILWFVLAIFTLGIGLLWLLPYIYTSLAHFYLDVKREEGLEQQIQQIIHLEEQPPLLEEEK